MRAMVLDAAHQPLRLAAVDVQPPGPGQVLIGVHACAVCRTDLHVVDGELTNRSCRWFRATRSSAASRRPAQASSGSVSAIVSACPGSAGPVVFANSADRAERIYAPGEITGYQIDGGYGEFTIADQRFCFAIPAGYSDLEAAPLLCAGLIGYRSLRMAGEARRLGLYGFGAAAHIIAQVARWQGREVYAFTSPGDIQAQNFARELGATWTGGSDQAPPERLDAAIIFAPVGPLVPAALRAVERGGAVVCAGIHMSPIPSFPYEILWGERVVRSVANLTRRDGEEFLELAPKVPVKTRPLPYALEQANEALDDLRAGRLQGAAVLQIQPSAR